MKLKLQTVIILFAFTIFSHCATNKDFITIEKELEETNTFERTHVHSGLKGDFLFYVSHENSKGDIWLYNLNENSKWQITSEDTEKIRIISVSTFYKYIIYFNGEKNIIYNVEENDEMFISDYPLPITKFSFMNNVNWINESLFYFTAATNEQMTNIYKAEFNEDGIWKISTVRFEIPDQHLNQKSIYDLSLSYNKTHLAFISYDTRDKKYIYSWNLKENQIKKMIRVRDHTPLIWSENNEDIYYYQENFLYSIDSKGIKNLVFSQNKTFHDLVYYPDHRFEFFYLTTTADYFFIHIKNIDELGDGKFLFNTPGLRNADVYLKSDYLYFDNSNDEIYSYNIKTTEIKKILDSASLFQFTPQ
jgi:hypothetical protein